MALFAMLSSSRSAFLGYRDTDTGIATATDLILQLIIEISLSLELPKSVQTFKGKLAGVRNHSILCILPFAEYNEEIQALEMDI